MSNFPQRSNPFGYACLVLGVAVLFDSKHTTSNNHPRAEISPDWYRSVLRQAELSW